MADRYDENRERSEGARGQDTGRRGESGRGNSGQRNWQSGSGNRGDEGQYGGYGQYGNYEGGRSMNRDFQSENWENEPNQGGYQRNYQGDEGRYANQRSHDEGYRNRSYSEGGQRNFPNEGQRGQNWDRSGESMTDFYPPRRNEWSSGHGISSGLGGAETSEYSSNTLSGSYYGGQGQFGGGLGQYGEQGRHAGRGPKGYKRSDERIREDVNEQLTQDPHIDAGDIEVEVKDGEVTLTGTVEARNIKRRAEDLIESISGVREIHNQLRVQSGQEMTGAMGTNPGQQKPQNK